MTLVIWFLGYFPNYGADLGSSWLGHIGRVVEPLFQPLGLDWRYFLNHNLIGNVSVSIIADQDLPLSSIFLDALGCVDAVANHTVL